MEEDTEMMEPMQEDMEIKEKKHKEGKHKVAKMMFKYCCLCFCCCKPKCCRRCCCCCKPNKTPSNRNGVNGLEDSEKPQQEVENEPEQEQNESFQYQVLLRCNELKDQIEEGQTKIECLKAEKIKLKRDYQSKFPKPSGLSQLKRSKNFNITRAKKIYELIIVQLLDHIKLELRNMLTAPDVKREGCITIVTSSENNQYGPYGLLLSAYKIRHPSLTIDEDMIEKVCKKLFVQLEGKMKEKVEANAETSLKLTQEMLFLIPPFVVGSKEMVDSYHEDLCDTNRKTWDEERKGDQLLWYRPVLMFGNQLHIAVKGLVGNCTEPIQEEKEEMVPIQSNPNFKPIVSSEITLYTDPGLDKALPDDQEAATGDAALKDNDPETPDLCNSIVPLEVSEIQNEKRPLALTAGQGTEELQAELDYVEETIIN